jgi:hypothetical protein
MIVLHLFGLYSLEVIIMKPEELEDLIRISLHLDVPLLPEVGV